MEGGEAVRMVTEVERMTGRSGFVWTVTVVERMAGQSGLVRTVMERGEAERTVTLVERIYTRTANMTSASPLSIPTKSCAEPPERGGWGGLWGKGRGCP